MQPVTFVLCILVLGAHTLLVAGVGCDYQGPMQVGESKATGNCILTTCVDNDAIISNSCPWVEHPQPCNETQDLSKPYPECCPTC